MNGLEALTGLRDIPPTTVAAVAVGAMVLVARVARGSTLSTPHETPGKSMAVRQPGWVARRRARRGIRHSHGRVGVGYTSAVRAVHLDVLVLNHHGYIGGAPGSGKTSLLRLLIQGYPGPVIALDTKGSPELAETVWGLPGHVWQIGGSLKLDLLDPEPAILAQQLLEGEIFTDRAIVYRAVAEHAVQRAAWVLRWQDKPREPRRILELLSSPATLAAAIRQAMPPNDPMAERWLVELDSPTATIREAFQTFGERLGTLMDSPAGRSLGAGTDAVRLADVLATGGELLVQLDPRYGAISRKIGAWTLIAMLRLAAELRQARWQGRCLFVVDEPRLLEHEGRHLANLFGTARDAGLGLVVADWGIAGLSAVDRDLPDAIMRSTAWQIVLRQGSAADAEQMAAQFGTVWREDVSRSSDGRTVSRLREEPRVYASWLLSLPRGSGWLRVAPLGENDREHIERVVFALPAASRSPRRLALAAGHAEKGDPGGSAAVIHGSPSGSPGGSPAGGDPEFEVDNDTGNPAASVKEVRGDTRPHPEPDLSTLEGRKRAVYRHVRLIDGWRRWRGWFDVDGYPRMWGELAHRLIYEWEQGPIPPRWTIDHTCGEKDCLDHLEAVTLGENLRRRHARERGELPIGHAGLVPPVRDGAPAPAEPPASEDEATGPSADGATGHELQAAVQRLRADGWSLRRIAKHLGVGYATVWRSVEASKAAEQPEVRADSERGPTAPAEDRDSAATTTGAEHFAIALFARYDRPAVEPRTVSREDLVDLLTTFDELADKRQARCWSPTRYAEGAISRANAGVEAVSCLVFDCDRIEPDWARLEPYWYLAHTTYQHTPEHPRWRLVLPLAAPVPARGWALTWRRAHAVLCPETDPNCKDASRQYYLPSHPPGVQPESRCHEGRLLDAATLPELPPEPKRSELRLLSPSAVPRDPTERERRRAADYLRKVIATLETAPAGGRNDALNRAAWTLGHWVAAGALDQAEVEDALFAAAERNGLVSDPKDGPQKTWATIRSGLSKGLQQPVDLDADDRPPAQRRRRSTRASRRSR